LKLVEREGTDAFNDLRRLAGWNGGAQVDWRYFIDKAVTFF